MMQFFLTMLISFILLIMAMTMRYFFFFKAEDGIRDKLVTGVQTCALPILAWFNTDKETLAPATRVGGARGVLAGFVAGDRGVYHSLHRRPRERGDPQPPMCVVTPSCGHSYRKTQSGGYGSRVPAQGRDDKG